jgi:deoxyadenosine/deoxycytidine kinase
MKMHTFCAPNLYSGIDDQSWFSKLLLFLNWWNQQLKPWFIILFKKLYSNLVGQIHKRGREYENQFHRLFKSLERRYEAWIHFTEENYLS